MCEHKKRVGDNYGESCMDCGKQLTGFGYGGWFGSNMQGNETCIHNYQPFFDSESNVKICIYCEDWKEEVPT